MNTPRIIPSGLVYATILRSAALLVPGKQRGEWLAEWKSELWYVRQRCDRQAGNFPRDRQIMRFCLGAFQDALWLRRDGLPPKTRKLVRSGSPLHCITLLGTFAAATLILALLLPDARNALLPAPYPDARSLVMISSAGSSIAASPTISAGEYQSWSRSTRRFLTALAFYRVSTNRIQVSGRPPAQMLIAHASGNLFQLLKLPVSRPDFQEERGRPELVLTHAAWREFFHSDPHIAGRVLSLGGRQVTVAGVISEDSWRLPGRMDAWLLEDGTYFSALPPGSKGFLLARVRRSFFSVQPDDPWYMSAPAPDGGRESFVCTSLAAQTRHPFFVFLFGLVFAGLALPAITSLTLGEYPRHRDPLLGVSRLRRWFFLLAKMAFALLIVYFGALDLSHFSRTISPASSQYLAIFASFAGCLFAFRWALKDQRQRCPVCLHLLTNPTPVGQPSRIFLAWNGTELICVGGHGLLHIPELSTSWFRTQRWLSLDPSWRSLFSESYLAGIT